MDNQKFTYKTSQQNLWKTRFFPGNDQSYTSLFFLLKIIRS